MRITQKHGSFTFLRFMLDLRNRGYRLHHSIDSLDVVLEDIDAPAGFKIPGDLCDFLGPLVTRELSLSIALAPAKKVVKIALPAALDKFIHVQSLVLDLHARVTPATYNHIAHMPNLRHLKVHDRMSVMVGFSTPFARLRQLDVNCRGDIVLSDSTLQSLSTNLEQLSLTYADNNSSGPAVVPLRWFATLTRIQVLHIAGNRVEDLPPTMACMTRLQRLSIYDTSVKQVPDGLEKLPHLTDIYMVSNRIEIVPACFLRILQKHTTAKINLECNLIGYISFLYRDFIRDNRLWIRENPMNRMPVDVPRNPRDVVHLLAYAAACVLRHHPSPSFEDIVPLELAEVSHYMLSVVISTAAHVFAVSAR